MSEILNNKEKNFAMKDRLLPAGSPASGGGQGGDEVTAVLDQGVISTVST